MSVRLDGTTAGAVAMSIAQERFRQGSSAVGRVLTLVIVADESSQADAVAAAAMAAREHPSRILVAIPRPGRGPARLDAVVTVGGSEGLGELVELRMRGPLAHQVASVVLPLLVPDAPVVVWWPGSPPAVPGEDPVGRLAQRRITDAAACSRPMRELEARRAAYTAGDTDLSWTRLTPWRSLIAASLDLPHDPITGVTIGVQRGNPSGPLLASWLHRCLGVDVTLRATRGPGVTSVAVHTEHGDIAITRPDGRVARLSRPGMPDREAALPRRTPEALVAEELRRLDPDEIYGEALAGLQEIQPAGTGAAGGRGATGAARSGRGAKGTAKPRRGASRGTAS